MNNYAGSYAAGAESAPRSTPHPHQHIMLLTERDVLNGRGQGVQRFKGNVIFRQLVLANKELYCQARDKSRVPQALVSAVREAGGRFLKQDERTHAYHDIGDTKAKEKTQQALREGQKEIRQQLYERGVWNERDVGFDECFDYCLEVLRGLYHEEVDIGMHPAPSPMRVPQRQRPIEICIPVGFGSNSASIAESRNQLPTASARAGEVASATRDDDRDTVESLGSLLSSNSIGPRSSEESNGCDNSRSTEHTNHQSLMDASVMTIELDDMSTWSFHGGERSSRTTAIVA